VRNFWISPRRGRRFGLYCQVYAGQRGSSPIPKTRIAINGRLVEMLA
jgi:hypothetical protein